MFKLGKSIKQVAGELDRAEKTVADYLAEYITTAKPASIAPWVPDATFRRIQQAIGQHGADRLKPVFVALDETVPYEYIRIVAAYLQSQEKTDRK